MPSYFQIGTSANESLSRMDRFCIILQTKFSYDFISRRDEIPYLMAYKTLRKKMLNKLTEY